MDTENSNEKPGAEPTLPPLARSALGWSERLDMLVYRLWWWRWRKRFIRDPKMLVPFMDTATRWAHQKLTPEEIEECRESWRGIVTKNRQNDRMEARTNDD